jgi:phosphoribosyl 1,2-cyclic phosphodiesterase
LVTHDHTDHIAGIERIHALHDIPVFANAATAKAIAAIAKKRPRFKIFTTAEPFRFGDLDITPFSIPHDTPDPVGFVVHMMGKKVGFCADLGMVTSTVRNHLQNADYLYLEANHQISMVHASHRPKVYKDRVLGKQGHLSNDECAALLVALHHAKLHHVHLAHLSSECNTEQVALEVVRSALQQKGLSLDLSVAYQDRVSRAIVF